MDKWCRSFGVPANEKVYVWTYKDLLVFAPANTVVEIDGVSYTMADQRSINVTSLGIRSVEADKPVIIEILANSRQSKEHACYP
ncbi:MAG: hypothetical protein DRJ64_06510 [Thermoprotei archaeon]|nr:MAG: hypothetical protein DRJ64_06510 [Thermoprotei archaeon]